MCVACRATRRVAKITVGVNRPFSILKNQFASGLKGANTPSLQSTFLSGFVTCCKTDPVQRIAICVIVTGGQGDQIGRIFAY
jgi:hypothetical protein